MNRGRGKGGGGRNELGSQEHEIEETSRMNRGKEEKRKNGE